MKLLISRKKKLNSGRVKIKQGLQPPKTVKMSVDLRNLTKVNMIINEYTRLWLEIQNEDYLAINDRINSVITGINLLRNDVEARGERNIREIREEYDQFMARLHENEVLGDQDKITRYSRKIQENLLVIRAQIGQRPHNVPKVNNLSMGIIILLGDMENRWYR